MLDLNKIRGTTYYRNQIFFIMIINYDLFKIIQNTLFILINMTLLNISLWFSNISTISHSRA